MTEIVVTDPTIVVVLGKKQVRKDEIDALHTFGAALHRRGKTLATTKSEGVPAEIAKAYEEAGGTTLYIDGAWLVEYEKQVSPKKIIVFTNMQMQTDLDKKVPNWRERDWVIIHNPKATQEAARHVTQLLKEFGTPL